MVASTQRTESGPRSASSLHLIAHPLTRALIDAFQDNKEGGAATPASLIPPVIKAFELILEELGVEPKKLFAGGALGEILAAAVIPGATVNPSMQGPDVRLPDGTHLEIKESHSKLGEKANLNIPLPTPNAGETTDAYYGRVSRQFLMKGPIQFTHHYTNTDSHIYTFSAAFMGFYARTKQCMGSQKLNIGAVSCTVCTKVHRLVKLMELDLEWTRAREDDAADDDDDERDWKKTFDTPVVQECDSK